MVVLQINSHGAGEAVDSAAKINSALLNPLEVLCFFDLIVALLVASLLVVRNSNAQWSQMREFSKSDTILSTHHYSSTL